MKRSKTVSLSVDGYGDLEVPTRWPYAVIGRYGREGAGYLAMERGAETLDAARRGARGLSLPGGDLVVETRTGTRYARIVGGVR